MDGDFVSPAHLAFRLAHRAHEGQRDRDGHPHIAHVERVVRMAPESAASVAWLHDVIEDAPAFRDEVETILLTVEERRALNLLTRREGEGYMRYIDRILGDHTQGGTIAREVKEPDLVDNLHRSLMGRDPAAHRYRTALQRFWSAGR